MRFIRKIIERLLGARTPDEPLTGFCDREGHFYSFSGPEHDRKAQPVAKRQ